MKFLTSCLLAIAILYTARGQSFSKGNCDPNLETVNDFDDTKYAGKWYQIEESFISQEVDTKCYIANFNLVSDSVYQKNCTFIRLSDPDTIQRVNYIAEDNTSTKGKMIVRPGLIQSEQPFWALDTDYDNYAVMYSCVSYQEGKFEYVWINARIPHPDDAIIANAEEVLKKNNINVKLFKSDQSCE